MLKHKKMSLFDAPPGSILMHACNAQGVWGRGIAAQFKTKFPQAYKQYVEMCEMYLDAHPLYGSTGKMFLLEPENNHRIVCLVTSYDYIDPDSSDTILLQTTLALDDLCSLWKFERKLGPIYCNKFNSGLFGVPWEKTETVLEYFVNKYDLDITVCEL